MKRTNYSKLRSIIVLLCAVIFVDSAFAQTTLSFKSSVQYGSQENNLSVVISSDFDGDYSIERVQKATWKDITGEFNLATDKEFVEAGKIDLSKWTKAGKPLHVAFKYVGQESTRPTQRGWGISEVIVNDKGTDKRIPIKSFTIVNSPDNQEGTTWLQSSTWMRFHTNLTKGKSESWAIAKIVN